MQHIKVNTRLTDMKIHDVIDKINPTLRSIDTVNGKKRVREFDAMAPEDAYSLFEAIAEINGLEENLKKWPQTEDQKNDEQLAEEIEEEHTERRSPFTFSKCNIGIGEEIHSLEDPSIVCVVVDDKHVEYDGKKYALSYLAKEILQWKHLPQGPRHFTYKGEIVDDIRTRIESK